MLTKSPRRNQKTLSKTLNIFGMTLNGVFWVKDKSTFDPEWKVLLWFYGISTIAGYLMANTFYSYVLDIFDM